MTDLPPTGSNTASDHSTSDGSSDYGAFLVDMLVRVAFMLFFGLVSYVTFVVMIVMGIVQVIVALVTQDANKELQGFGRAAANYIKETMAYVAFATDEKPFPFGKPFPKGE